MDHYKTVVVDFLQADRAVFVNTKCRLPLGRPVGTDHPARICSCDAVVVDLRHGAVFLCEAAIGQKCAALIKKLAYWTSSWDSLESALRRECKVPKNWRIHVWLFVPQGSIELLDEKLEHLRQTVGSKFKVKITSLEDVQPWRATDWVRSEAAWETIGRRLLHEPDASTESRQDLEHSAL